jgi:ComF family protein
MQFFRDFLNGLSALIFPPVCKGCDRRMPAGAGVVCQDCWQSLHLFPESERSNKALPEYLDLVWPVFLFDDLFQRIVHALKYQGNISLGRELGRRMAAHLPTEFHKPLPACLTPIPLHPIKYRERGYNQAEAIAQGVSEILAVPVETRLLKRIKHTATQTQLNAEERKENMLAAFAVNDKNHVSAMGSIVLVDDVFTTGATIGSAAKVLREAGWRHIIALTAAAPL